MHCWKLVRRLLVVSYLCSFIVQMIVNLLDVVPFVKLMLC